MPAFIGLTTLETVSLLLNYSDFDSKFFSNPADKTKASSTIYDWINHEADYPQ